MYNISYKYKQVIFFIFKLIIVLCAIFFIYKKLTENQLLSFTKFKEQFVFAFSKNIWALLGVLLFTDANWFLEIFKWKTLVSSFKHISFLKAYEQSLGSLTLSLITPNRIGEYGAKALYFDKIDQKKIVGLNFVGNMEQLLATFLFGSFGLLFFIFTFNTKISITNLKYVFIVFAIASLIFIFKKHLKFQKLKKYLAGIYTFLKIVPRPIYSKTLLLSFARYLVFSHQFYFLLLLFGAESNYFTLMSLIFSMYFMASFIPSISIFDWAIKGSVAVWLFSFIGLNELTIVTITSFMWVLNFAIPAIFGTIFVLNFKTKHYS